jgi:hypothetical protein
MTFDSEIVIVSGLPRSGTSLMMQMLQAGGIEVVTDNIRAADTDNPRGYFELETAKTIERDSSWLPRMQGKAFKMVSQLLYHLPPTERCRIIFMQRNLDEILVSQRKMLLRRNAAVAPHDQMKQAFLLHLEGLCRWLDRQSNLRVLFINYNELLEDPRAPATEVREFLDGIPSVEKMTRAVVPELYRNRNGSPVF